MPTVAFLTDRERPAGMADDRLAVGPLARLGVSVRFVAWEDAEPDPAVSLWVIRSPWNYHRDAAAFLGRVARLVPLANPAGLVRWNADKRYLVDLAERGVPIIPTVFGPRESLAALVEATGWEEAVVKPAVSAAGLGTIRVRGDCEESAFAPLASGEYLVQPFLPDVLSGGEISCVFLGGRYSHSVRKRPAEGNFLVHEEHGGRTEAASADSALIALGEAAIAACGQPTLYARVDWILTSAGPRLVELELIEPELFLRFDTASPARFAEAIASWLPAPGAASGSGGAAR